MLTIVNYNKDEYNFPALLVLGCFDAIHIGHAELLKKAKLQAKINGLDLGVMMFSSGKGGSQLYSFEERCAFLEKYNVKFVLNIDYTDEFKKTTAAQFLANVEQYINVKGYMSGKDFRFGAGAKGKSATLKKYAEDDDNGVWYTPVKDVLSQGEKVSTTLIKECLEKGCIARANELLGRNFAVKGTVCDGNERGTSMGIPTANIQYPENIVHVKQGVYGVEATFGGNTYKGVANFGPRPTFGEDTPVLETYILDYDGDLYGEEVTVSFINYIRAIRKFDDAEALCAQIKEDMAHIGEPDSCDEDEPLDIQAIEQSVSAPEEQPAAEEEVAEEAEPVTEEETEVAEPVAEEVIEEAEPVAEEVVAEAAEPVTEEVTEAAEPVAEETVEEAAEPVVEETVEEVTEPVAEEVVEEAEPVSEVIEEVTEEIAAEPVEETEEAVAGLITEEIVEEVTEIVTEEISEESCEETVAEETVETEPEEPKIAEESAKKEEITEITEVESEVTEEVTDVVTKEVTEVETVEEPVSEESAAEEPVAEETEEEPVEEPVIEEVPEETVPVEEPVQEEPREKTQEELDREFEEEFRLLLEEEARENAKKEAERLAALNGENND